MSLNDLSFTIKEEVEKLDEFIYRSGWDYPQLRTDLERLLSMVRSTKNGLEMKIQSLRDHART